MDPGGFPEIRRPEQPHSQGQCVLEDGLRGGCQLGRQSQGPLPQGQILPSQSSARIQAGPQWRWPTKSWWPSITCFRTECYNELGGCVPGQTEQTTNSRET